MTQRQLEWLLAEFVRIMHAEGVDSDELDYALDVWSPEMTKTEHAEVRWCINEYREAVADVYTADEWMELFMTNIGERLGPIDHLRNDRELLEICLQLEDGAIFPPPAHEQN